MNRIPLVVFGCMVIWVNSGVSQTPSPADLSKRPPYERLLKGEDAKKAEMLLKSITELQEADNYAEAMKLAGELVAMRTRGQGPDHYATIDTKLYLAGLAKVAALPEERRRGWRAAMELEGEAKALEEKEKYAEALALHRKILEWFDLLWIGLGVDGGADNIQGLLALASNNTFGHFGG